MEDGNLPLSSRGDSHQEDNMNMEYPLIPYDHSAHISETRIEIIPAKNALDNFLGHFETLNRELSCKYTNIVRLENDIATNRFENEGDLLEQREKLSIWKMEYDRENLEATKLLAEMKNGIGKLIDVDMCTRINALTAHLNAKPREIQKIEDQLNELKISLSERLGNMEDSIKKMDKTEYEVTIKQQNNEIMKLRQELNEKTDFIKKQNLELQIVNKWHPNIIFEKINKELKELNDSIIPIFPVHKLLFYILLLQ